MVTYVGASPLDVAHAVDSAGAIPALKGLTTRGSGGSLARKPVRVGEGNERGEGAGVDGSTRRWVAMKPRTLRSAAALFAFMVVGVVFAAGAQAAPGDLDLTFSGDGRQRTDFGGFGDRTWDRATGMAIQGDGKIVAVGSTAPDPEDDAVDFALARHNPNGSLDPSFSGDGRQTTDFGGIVGIDRATGVALQGDGKIVVVGSSDSDFALARYNPNGSLDASFSGDGKLRTNFGGSDEATGVALHANGKIVVVGSSDSDFALARYNPNGSLDPSFSGDGRQRTNFGGDDGARGVALQANGKIVVVGRSSSGADVDFALARYNPNGSLDASFSGDGRQKTNFSGPAWANDVVLPGDGKIIAAGVYYSGNCGGEFALARYNPNGSLDSSFSGDGRQRTGFGCDPAHERPFGVEGVALQANGRIVAAGTGRAAAPNGDLDFAIARYLGG
jgi:uncharacterized delta-60 repeat protein